MRTILLWKTTTIRTPIIVTVVLVTAIQSVTGKQANFFLSQNRNNPSSHPLWHKNVFTNRRADETEKSTKASDLDVIIFTSSAFFSQIIHHCYCYCLMLHVLFIDIYTYFLYLFMYYHWYLFLSVCQNLISILSSDFISL